MNLLLTNAYQLAVSTAADAFLLTIRDAAGGIASPVEMAITADDLDEPDAAYLGHVMSPSDGTRREVDGAVWLRVIPGHNPSGTIAVIS